MLSVYNGKPLTNLFSSLCLTLVPTNLLKLFLNPSLSDVILSLYIMVISHIFPCESCVLSYILLISLQPFFLQCILIAWRVFFHNDNRSYCKNSADIEKKKKKKITLMYDRMQVVLWLYLPWRIWLKKQRMRIRNWLSIGRVLCSLTITTKTGQHI